MTCSLSPQVFLAVLATAMAAPQIVPYQHVEIPAEPYIHQEIAAEPYVHIEPALTPEALGQVGRETVVKNILSHGLKIFRWCPPGTLRPRSRRLCPPGPAAA